MKTYYLFLFVIIALLVFSCKDDEITSPTFSLENEINYAKPFDFIHIYKADTGDSHFSINGGVGFTPFQDAYAENGYLIVTVNGNVINYFNLSLVKYYQISKGSWLNLYY